VGLWGSIKKGMGKLVNTVSGIIPMGGLIVNGVKALGGLVQNVGGSGAIPQNVLVQAGGIQSQVGPGGSKITKLPSTSGLLTLAAIGLVLNQGKRR